MPIWLPDRRPHRRHHGRHGHRGVPPFVAEPCRAIRLAAPISPNSGGGDASPLTALRKSSPPHLPYVCPWSTHGIAVPSGTTVTKPDKARSTLVGRRTEHRRVGQEVAS